LIYKNRLLWNMFKKNSVANTFAEAIWDHLEGWNSRNFTYLEAVIQLHFNWDRFFFSETN